MVSALLDLQGRGDAVDVILRKFLVQHAQPVVLPQQGWGLVKIQSRCLPHGSS